MDNIKNAISENTKVILLLTTYFNNNEMRQCKPLTVNGYGYFARWLNTYGYQPSDLLKKEKFDEIIERWQQADLHILVKKKVDFKQLDKTISDITLERIQTLLARGASLSMALDKWSAAGVWILDRGHDYYPVKIKQALKDQAPAVLFGIGNPELLSKPSIGFVGSRDARQQDLDVTKNYVHMINELDFQVVSGGAKGIDSHSMLASLANGNTSVGIIADSLFKASVNSQWREHLKSNNLALITPFYPEGSFSPSNAMLRNKFIYLLSQATVVICSTESAKGKQSGTFEGAKENLKNAWVPLLVSEHKQPNHLGNIALLNGLPKVDAAAKVITPNSTPESIQLLINNELHLLSNSKEALLSSANDVQVDLFGADTGEVAPQTIKRTYSDKSEMDFSSTDDTTTNSIPDEAVTPDTTKEEVIQKQAVTQSQPDLTQDEISNNQESVISCSDASLPTETTTNDHQNESLVAKTVLSNKVESSVSITMPLLNSFYQQLTALFEQHTKNKIDVCIDIEIIESHFPEFQLIGKTALDKWLKYLVENDLLLRPVARKKEFCLPVNNVSVGQSEPTEAAGLSANNPIEEIK